MTKSLMVVTALLEAAIGAALMASAAVRVWLLLGASLDTLQRIAGRQHAAARD